MSASFQAEFHRIQQALKKGLFRKVDHGGSAEELLELGAALRREGNAPHAALCLMAAAQCHRALEQPAVAAHHDAQAGQLLWREQLQLLARVDDAVFRDLVPEATACYLGAIHVHLAHEHRALAGTLYAEMADFLWALDRPRDAGMYYDKAATLADCDCAFSVAETLWTKALRCHVESRDYGAALDSSSCTLVLLHRRLSREGVLGLQAPLFDALYSRMAELLMTKVLLLGVVGEFAQAFTQLDALQALTAAKLASSEVHTVLCPILSAFLSACQAQDRTEAEAVLREAPALVSPICADLMMRAFCRFS
eukprot:Tamp_22220.p1 GENE.Tamp_22220~~Tamp_22220.p1  ORF type:complete len:309 (+),score=66.46 Tamp_22220:81-1007(+)